MYIENVSKMGNKQNILNKEIRLKFISISCYLL